MNFTRDAKPLFDAHINRFIASFDVTEDGNIIKRSVILNHATVFSPKDFVRYYDAYFYYGYDHYPFIALNVLILLPMFLIYGAFMIHPTTMVLGAPVFVFFVWIIRWLPHYLAMKQVTSTPKVIQDNPLGFFEHLKRLYFLQLPRSIEPLQVGGPLNLHPLGKFVGVMGMLCAPIFIGLVVKLFVENFSAIAWLDVPTITAIILENIPLFGFSVLLAFGSMLPFFEYLRRGQLNKFWKNGYDPSVLIKNYEKIIEIYGNNSVKGHKAHINKALEKLVYLKIAMYVVFTVGLCLSLSL